MEIKDFKQYWNIVINIFKEDTDGGKIAPSQTAKRIVRSIGVTNAKECFAMIARLKPHEGRIYGMNREWANHYDINPEIFSPDVRRMLPNLDAVHPTHINQVMTHIISIS